ncbi:molecular chaperone HtpG [Bacteroidetes/Chlorobi group bacterium Naka2016]|jgi:molecular chaperone HtpG|nr:MAG: molecular chaperone HtpG [Bacteroidetes/Chlorobi group bacterium Naka2016]
MEHVENRVQEFEFVAEIKQLLDIIINSLYTHPEIFIRELISNSSDALHKIRFKRLTEPNILNPELELRIDITVDPETKLFKIEDTGIGMTKEEVISQIGTIAHSGTANFLKNLQKYSENFDINLIGKFGVGFYSVFMVTDEVTLETRSYLPDSSGVRWKSNGKEKYSIEEIDRPTRGTLIYFTLKDEYKEFAQPERVKEIIRKYSNFVDFPIYVNNEKVNTIDAIWRKKKDEVSREDIENFYKYLTGDDNPPLSYLHFSVEGNVNFNALLFIPDSPPSYYWRDFFDKTISLYSHKVFIQDDNPEILPEYLRFIRGVLDTDDLPLNISRETIQNSPLKTKIKQILTNKILSHLEELAENEKEKYAKFTQNFGQIFKGGITIDSANRDRIINLLRYQSTTLPENEYTSLKDYVSRMKENQKSIYYVITDSRSSLSRNPNLEYFLKNNYEVLVMTDPIDSLIVPLIREYDGKPLKSIDKVDVEIQKETDGNERLDPETANKLFERMKSVLGDRVLNVQESNRLVDSPVTLVAPYFGHDPQSEKIFKILDKNYQKSKKILEVNTAHPIIKNLAKLIDNSESDNIVEKIIEQLYYETLVLEGELEEPTELVKNMNEILQKFTELIGKS